MHLTARESRLLFRIVRELTDSLDCTEARQRIGRDILDLFSADYFASYVWDDRGGEFVDRVSLNMSDDNLRTYEAYYQFRDPITPKLQARRHATLVTDIMPQRDLVRTEFFNDFLARDGLWHGMNLYAYDGDDNIGDLRIWRSRRRERFEARDRDLLDFIRPVFNNTLRNIRRFHGMGGIPTRARLMERFGLTSREADIALAVAEGKMDERIAADFGIAFSTVRTHIKRIFAKLDVCNRASVIRRLYEPG